ncbi:MAG: hypothetical protein WC457_00005, partial [Patescibacteria group bacterium]
QKSNNTYEQTIAGVVSTNPTIIVGNGKTSQTAPLAMVGRVPVKFSNENGNIQRGDLLVASGVPGKAMRYDPVNDNSQKVVGIIGIALDNSSDSLDGKIMTLIRTGWVYNKTEAVMNLQDQIETIADAEGIDLDTGELSVSGDSGTISYSGSGNLDLSNNALINVSSIVGYNDAWSIDANGSLIAKVTTSEGDKNIYGMTSENAEITLSGTGTLQMGEVVITFATGTQEIIDETSPIKVNVTLTSLDANGIAVIEKSAQGFKVKELGGGTSNATFDWMVIAKRKIQTDANDTNADTNETNATTTTETTSTTDDGTYTTTIPVDTTSDTITTDDSASSAADLSAEALAEADVGSVDSSLDTASTTDDGAE